MWTVLIRRRAQNPEESLVSVAHPIVEQCTKIGGQEKQDEDKANEFDPLNPSKNYLDQEPNN